MASRRRDEAIHKSRLPSSIVDEMRQLRSEIRDLSREKGKQQSKTVNQ